MTTVEGLRPSPTQLVLCPHYPPRRFGGVEKVVQELARAHRRAGDRVLVATLDLHLDSLGGNSTPWVLDTDETVRVVRVPSRAPSAGQRTETMLARQETLARAIEHHALGSGEVGESARVLQVHDWFVAPAAFALRERHGWPILAIFHSNKQAETEGKLPDRKQRIVDLQRELVERADAHFCLSRSMADSLSRSHGLESERFEVLRCGVDPVEARLDRRRGTSPKILYLGRLQAEKEVDVLVRAFAEVSELLPDVRLQIVGRGRQREALEALGRSLGVGERIDFEPFTSDGSRVDRVLREASVLVLPSRLEGFGLVVLEAMARGTPVITSRCGGPTEIVRCGETGRCFDIGDVTMLACHLRETFDAWQQTQGMARRGFDDVQRRFRWSEAARCLRRVAGELLAPGIGGVVGGGLTE